MPTWDINRFRAEFYMGLLKVHGYVRFEAVMAVTMKNTVFRVVIPCSTERARHFGRAYRLQGRTVRHARDQKETD
jgi:hypothetical protein